MTVANIDAQLAVGAAANDAIDGEFIGRWRRVIVHILGRAPQRLDILPVYFNWLLTKRQFTAMRSMLDIAQKNNPHHPVVLWFGGFLLLEGQDQVAKRQGLAMMRQALLGGIERFTPIDAKIKAALDGGGGAL
jgi:hypothetical protein